MKLMTRKQFVASATLLINIIVIFGIVLPALISATDTFLVVTGFILLPLAVYAGYVSIIKIFETDEINKDKWGR